MATFSDILVAAVLVLIGLAIAPAFPVPPNDGAYLFSAVPYKEAPWLLTLVRAGEGEIYEVVDSGTISNGLPLRYGGIDLFRDSPDLVVGTDMPWLRILGGDPSLMFLVGDKLLLPADFIDWFLCFSAVRGAELAP